MGAHLPRLDGASFPTGRCIFPDSTSLEADLGFEGVEHVRIGRMVELEAADPDCLSDLCEKLLANSLIEDYEVELVESQ